MFKQFEAINTCPKSHSVSLNAAWTKTAVPAEVLDTLGYAVNPIFWYKTDQNVQAPQLT